MKESIYLFFYPQFVELSLLFNQLGVPLGQLHPEAPNLLLQEEDLILLLGQARLEPDDRLLEAGDLHRRTWLQADRKRERSLEAVAPNRKKFASRNTEPQNSCQGRKGNIFFISYLRTHRVWTKI